MFGSMAVNVDGDAMLVDKSWIIMQQADFNVWY